jgi:hypothetical protein
MSRDKALIYRERVLTESIRQRDLVKTLPENTLLLFTYRSYSNEKKWVDTKVAAFTTNVWNLTSIQCHMVASDTHTWEWDHDMQRLRASEEADTPLDKYTTDLGVTFGRHPLKFQYMKAWEPIAPECVPLLVGYPIKYPRFYTLLKG